MPAPASAQSTRLGFSLLLPLRLGAVADANVPLTTDGILERARDFVRRLRTLGRILLEQTA